MKRSPLLLFLLVAASLLSVAADYEVIADKAARFFRHREWASASAMYELMLEQAPDVADTYSHAIIAASMRADTTDEMRLLGQAMQHSIPFDSVMSGVRKIALMSGNIDTYEHFLLNAQKSHPWLERAIDRFLLDYYCFRADGQKMVRYSRLLLHGLPDNEAFLSTLAQGQLLEGNVDSAMTTYRNILSLNPDNYEALLYIGNRACLEIPHSQPARRDSLKRVARTTLQHAYAIRPTPFVADLLKNL